MIMFNPSYYKNDVIKVDLVENKKNYDIVHTTFLVAFFKHLQNIFANQGKIEKDLI